MAHDYAFDPGWYHEQERINLLCETFDPMLERHWDGLGLQPGQGALDLGAGTGTVALLMARRFGLRVTALDADPRFLVALEHPRIRVVRDDARRFHSPSRFKLVHARFLLVHLDGAPADALARWTDTLEQDGYITLVESRYDTWMPMGEHAPDKVREAYLRMTQDLGWDQMLGAHLSTVLEEVGLRVLREDIHDGEFRCGDPLSRAIALSLRSQARRLYDYGVSNEDLEACESWLTSTTAGGRFASTHMVTGCR